MSKKKKGGKSKARKPMSEETKRKLAANKKAKRGGKKSKKASAKATAPLLNESKAYKAGKGTKKARAAAHKAATGKSTPAPPPPRKSPKKKAAKKSTAKAAPRKSPKKSSKKRGSRKSPPRQEHHVATASGKHGTWRPKKGKNKNKVSGKIAKEKHETTLKQKGGGLMKITDILRFPNSPGKMAWGPMITFVAGMAVFTGVACVIHSHVVTMPPKGAAHAAMGKDAALRKYAKPTIGVYVAETGVAVVAGIAAGALRKKFPKVAGACAGVMLACLLYEGRLFVKHEIIPRIAKVKDGDEISLFNRWHPEVQMNNAALQRATIDAQDADPAYIGWQQTADGRLDPSYAYGQPNGNPDPTTVGLVQPNAASGILGLIDPLGELGIGTKPKSTGLNAAGRAPGARRHSALLLGQQQNAASGTPPQGNAAGACGTAAGCGKPCCDDKTIAALVEEANALDTLHKANPNDGYAAAASGLRNQAEGLRNQAAGHTHEDNVVSDSGPAPAFLDWQNPDGTTVRMVPQNAAAGAPAREAPRAAAPQAPAHRPAAPGAPAREAPRAAAPQAPAHRPAAPVARRAAPKGGSWSQQQLRAKHGNHLPSRLN